MLRTLIVGAAVVAALPPAEAVAQAGGEATMYSRGHFVGQRRTISGPTKFEVPFVMRSVTLPEGSSWEFCSGKTYSGCRQYSKSVPATVMTVRSARPSNAVIRSGEPARGAVPAGAAGQSLRGNASEYFVAPDAGGNRIEVTPGTAEAMSQRAIDFCRTRGWRASAHARMQTVGSRLFLADVLCVDSGE